ncbi:MAG: histidine kinase [Clostridiales bacterium]|nr:histidine kinase [Clostridiales bacterium]
MEFAEGVITTLDYILSTKRKRHIAGGILLSTSLFLGGLAVTVMTIKNEVTSIE